MSGPVSPSASSPVELGDRTPSCLPQREEEPGPGGGGILRASCRGREGLAGPLWLLKEAHRRRTSWVLAVSENHKAN